MTLGELAALVPGFDELSPYDKICLFGWWLHTQGEVESFGNSEIRECYRQLASAPPDLSVYLPRMADKNRKPPYLLREKGEYKLEGTVRRRLDQLYGSQPTTIAVTKLLSDLPAKIPDIAERTFLSEALKCYQVEAFRAAIVMAWNLAFDHMLRWIMADPARLANFNAAIPRRYPKKPAITIATREGFEELKESEVIDVCNNAGLFSGNIGKILREKLDRRNMAAHPSTVVVTQPQADDVITDLVNNVVLALS